MDLTYAKNVTEWDGMEQNGGDQARFLLCGLSILIGLIVSALNYIIEIKLGNFMISRRVKRTCFICFLCIKNY